MASETLNRSVEVLQSITPISSKVEEWNNNMKNNEYSTAAYEQAVASAGAAGIYQNYYILWDLYLMSRTHYTGFHVSYCYSYRLFWLTVPSQPHLKLIFLHYFLAVENLNLLVPTLLDKLKVVEDKKPVNNVTTNIMRIRELIAQARSVAKKVRSVLLTHLVMISQFSHYH